MICISSEIEPDLVGSLEDQLCEWDPSPWALVANRLSGEGTLEGYFSNSEEALDAWGLLQACLKNLPSKPKLIPVKEEDWAMSYRKHFHSWQSGNLHAVPSWESQTFSIPSGHKAIFLDPGMAFGTGNHETTRLCIHAVVDFIDRTTADPISLACVDAGCGSGILSLSAKALGFGVVRGFDNDNLALKVARENALANGMLEDVDYFFADLATPLDKASVDLLLANVQADALCQNRANLLGAIAPKGTLCLSGVLTTESEEVERIFSTEMEKLGSSFSIETSHDGEWASLAFDRIS